MEEKDKNKILYAALIFILVIFISFFLFKIYSNYTLLKNHRAYFKQKNPEIESWMTIQGVIKRFNIPKNTVLKELKINDTLSNERLTIDDICKKNHLNCTEVADALNRLKTS